MELANENDPLFLSAMYSTSTVGNHLLLFSLPLAFPINVHTVVDIRKSAPSKAEEVARVCYCFYSTYSTYSYIT